MVNHKEYDEYRGDVVYEEYRRGLPEGSLSDERIDDGYWDGVSAQSLVNQEAQRQEDVHLEQQYSEQEDDSQWMGGLDWSGEEE